MSRVRLLLRVPRTSHHKRKRGAFFSSSSSSKESVSSNNFLDPELACIKDPSNHLDN